MLEDLLISSKQNPKIKTLVDLQKSSERNRTGWFTIEGSKEIEKAIANHFHIISVFYYKELANQELLGIIRKETKDSTSFFELTQDVFSKVAYRENSTGIILLAEQKTHNFASINLKKNPLILVLESLEKPGNIGAIYRTADAAGIDLVIVADLKTDFYNPNTVRASLGCVFTAPTVICKSSEAIAWLKSRQIPIYTTYLNAAKPYHHIDYKMASAIVVGTEATGVSPIWVENSNDNIIIPMQGAADSLNVSTSTAIVLFEACRQRDFK